jgi:PAS domain S-box-containing protein
MANPIAPAWDYSRQIVDSSTEYAMLFLDTEGVIRSWNPGAQRVFGFTEAEAVGQHLGILYRPDDRSSGVPQAELRAAESTGCASDTRWLVHKGGESFWAEGVTNAVRDEAGALKGFAKIARNASERYRLEQALERSNDELQRFAFTISHDLTEPLRTVRSYAELLARRYKGQLDSDANEFIDFMVDGTKRMGQLLNDIVAYSRAGREDKTRMEPTQAANVLQWALMNLDGLVKETEAVITWDPLPTLYVDQAQLMALYQQLLTNSIKFRSQETPRIHISAQRAGEDMWELAVRDNGIGVAPEYHERVFGVFKRLAGREVPGTGIGLAICRKIVEAHRGRIWMESDAGKGATVRFTLPAHD